MEPITTITTALTAGHHGISLLKGIAQALKDAGKSEALNDLIEAQMAVMELIEKQQHLTIENGELKSRVKELEENLRLRTDVMRVGDWLVLRRDSEEQRKCNRFCLTCYGYEGKLVGLSVVGCLICANRRKR